MYVDVMSCLLSHIKIPFRQADTILHIVVRFIMSMVIHGHLTTQYSMLDMIIFSDPMGIYTDIHKRMAKGTTLSDYISLVII